MMMISANTITKVVGNEAHLLRPKGRKLPAPAVANNPGDIEVVLREQCRRAEKTLAVTVEELARCNRALESLLKRKDFLGLFCNSLLSRDY